MIQQDIRYAVRSLAANRGFTLVAVLSLALGIGANTAIFSLLNGVLMRTLPVPNPQELVILTDPSASGVSVGMEDGKRSLVSYPEFRQLQEQNSTFASLMASESSLKPIEARIAGGEPEQINVRLVSASYFSTLGVPALVGRTFDATHEPAPGSVPEAVISHEFWQRRFGGRSDAAGQTISLAGGSFSVIGVTPASFLGETVGERPDAWLPLAMQAAVLPGPRLAARPARERREGDVAAHVRPAEARRVARARGGERERRLPAGADGVLRIDGRCRDAEAVPRSAAGAAERGDGRVLAAR